MKNISCNLGRVFMKVCALLIVSVFLTSCYVGQTSYAGEDSVYYSHKTHKNKKKKKQQASYDYVYDDDSKSSVESQNSTEVRIGKKYIDPTSNASDLLYDDNDSSEDISTNSTNHYSEQIDRSYTYNYSKDNWGDDDVTIVNNYYYGGYGPYYSN